MKKNTRQHGAVLLIAILVASVALAVGMGVYNRTYKELMFASFWKQTQVAFASADAGLECAMYWEMNPVGAGSASCFSSTIALWNPNIAGSFEKDTSGGGCVRVEITVNNSGLPLSPPATTTYARGYNVSCTVLSAGTNPRIVERGLKVTY